MFSLSLSFADMFAFGLDKVSITIPAAIQAGASSTLQCQYDLGEDSLYTVKWYKGRREFFRYTAKEIPPIKVFSPSGFYVDVSKQLFNGSNVIRLLRLLDFLKV